MCRTRTNISSVSIAKAGNFSRRQFLAAPLLAAREGADILLDVRSRRLIAVHNAAVAERFLAPPGSTVKPLVLTALLRTGRLTAAESLPCPGRLTIAGRSFIALIRAWILPCASKPPSPIPAIILSLTWPIVSARGGLRRETTLAPASPPQAASGKP